jgi:hypothetical protein
MPLKCRSACMIHDTVFKKAVFVLATVRIWQWHFILTLWVLLVNKVTPSGLDNQGLIPSQGRDFPPLHQPVSWLFMGTVGSFPGVKELEHETDHSPPPSAKIKNVWNIGTGKFLLHFYITEMCLNMLLLKSNWLLPPWGNFVDLWRRRQSVAAKYSECLYIAFCLFTV